MKLMTIFLQASMTSTVTSDSKDPIAYIDQFTTLVTDLFSNYILNLANSFWSSYYALFFLPLVIWAAVNGILYTAGKKRGEKVRAEIGRAISIMVIMLVGFTLLPIIELTGGYISEIMQKQSSAFSTHVYNQINNDKGVRYDFTSDTEENRVLWSHLSKSDMNSYNVIYSLNNEVENHYRVLSTEDAKTIENIKLESGIDPNNTPSAGEMIKQPPVPELSIWDLNVVDLITYALLIAGNCLKCLMLVFRLVLLALFRFSFPIALALSLIPTMEKTIFTWLESYITVVLLGVTLSLISAISTFTSHIAIASDLYEASFMAALMAFVSGIMYLLSPAITVMLFGGSSTVSQLPNQFVMAAAGVISLAKTAAKVFPKQDVPNNPLTPSPPSASDNPISPNSLQ